jgi:hypothetical protein
MTQACRQSKAKYNWSVQWRLNREQHALSRPVFDACTETAQKYVVNLHDLTLKKEAACFAETLA